MKIIKMPNPYPSQSNIFMSIISALASKLKKKNQTKNEKTNHLNAVKQSKSPDKKYLIIQIFKIKKKKKEKSKQVE